MSLVQENALNQLSFNEITITPVNHNNQPWLSARQISTFLGYKDQSSVNRIFSRNQDEFTNDMSTSVNLTDLNGNEKTTRIFSLRGAHLVAIFARTPIAKTFRKWLLDILDNEVKKPEYKPLTTLTSAQKLEIRKTVGRKAHNDGESHKRVYHALYNHFSVSEYGDIQQEQFDEAISFIASLDITPRVQNQLPAFFTRVLVTIENGNVTQSQVPDDAFVFSKSRLPSFLKEPGIFTLQEMAQIAEAANKRMIEIAMHANNAVPKQLPNRNW
jgi:prophage antirepressor-like protein